MEVWKDIEEFDNRYQVSNLGRVRSLYNNKQVMRKEPYILKIIEDRYGYNRVSITLYRKNHLKSIHRLVANCFLEKIENKDQVNHIDGNKKNNSIENLEWCNHLENMQHASLLGLIKGLKGEKCPTSKLNQLQIDEIRELYKCGKTQTELSRTYNISQGQIGRIVRNERWKK